MSEDPIDLTKTRIVKFTKGKRKLIEKFDCGDSDLNEFLKDDALDHTKNNIAVTYLFLHSEEVIGFFCVSMTGIEPRPEALEILRARGKGYNLFPAIMIGRLGVDIRYQRKKIGSEIIQVVLGLAKKASKKIGCRFIVVDAYPKPKIIKFYNKNSFKFLEKTRKTTRMYQDLLSEF